LSTDPNRPRPRSSKKRRAVAGGGGRQTGGRVRGGNSTPPAGGIPGLWLAIGAVGVFVVGVLLASGTIGGGGAGGGGTPSPSSQVKGSLTVVSPSSSPVARGTNCPTSQPPAAPAGETRVVTIQTAKGSFEITLMSDLSPIAVGNFAALAVKVLVLDEQDRVVGADRGLEHPLGVGRRGRHHDGQAGDVGEPGFRAVRVGRAQIAGHA
jgi:hypothetical protein